MLDYEGFEIHWDGHASVRIEDKGFNVLVDPFNEVSPDVDADLVLITHRSEGHYDPEFIEQVCTDKTCVVVPESMEDESIPCQDVEYVASDEIIDVYGIEIQAVPSYSQGKVNSEGNGYRFVMRGTSFYVSGRTEVIEDAYELEGRVDVAFLPVDGEFNMDVDEAVKMAVRIKSDITVPYHYGKPFYEGSSTDLRGLKAELDDRNLRCEILESK